MMSARLTYALASTCCIIAGLTSRSAIGLNYFPTWVGDILWAMMAFFLTRLLLTNQPPWPIRTSLAISLTFCVSIECQQLYQADWLVQLRQSTIGGLVLGRGFQWSDLLSYLVGNLFSAVIDHNCINKYHSPQPAPP